MVCRSDHTEGVIEGRRVLVEGNERGDYDEKKKPIFGHLCKNRAKAQFQHHPVKTGTEMRPVQDERRDFVSIEKAV